MLLFTGTAGARNSFDLTFFVFFFGSSGASESDSFDAKSGISPSESDSESSSAGGPVSSGSGSFDPRARDVSVGKHPPLPTVAAFA